MGRFELLMRVSPRLPRAPTARLMCWRKDGSPSIIDVCVHAVFVFSPECLLSMFVLGRPVQMYPVISLVTVPTLDSFSYCLTQLWRQTIRMRVCVCVCVPLGLIKLVRVSSYCMTNQNCCRKTHAETVTHTVGHTFILMVTLYSQDVQNNIHYTYVLKTLKHLNSAFHV